jgi:hypothetical protein
MPKTLVESLRGTPDYQIRPATITTVDGKSVQGTITDIFDDCIRVSAPPDTYFLPFTGIVSIRFKDAGPAQES